MHIYGVGLDIHDEKFDFVRGFDMQLRTESKIRAHIPR